MRSRESSSWRRTCSSSAPLVREVTDQTAHDDEGRRLRDVADRPRVDVSVYVPRGRQPEPEKRRDDTSLEAEPDCTDGDGYREEQQRDVGDVVVDVAQGVDGRSREERNGNGCPRREIEEPWSTVRPEAMRDAPAVHGPQLSADVYRWITPTPRDGMR